MRLIDADLKITAILFDIEHDDTYTEQMTIAELIDLCSVEGCPHECVVRCEDGERSE